MRRAYADVVVVAITAPPEFLPSASPCGRVAATARSSSGSAARVDDAAAAPDVTIVNVGSAEYHARQLVRIIKGDRWDE